MLAGDVIIVRQGTDGTDVNDTFVLNTDVSILNGVTNNVFLIGVGDDKVSVMAIDAVTVIDESIIMVLDLAIGDNVIVIMDLGTVTVAFIISIMDDVSLIGNITTKILVCVGGIMEIGMDVIGKIKIAVIEDIKDIVIVRDGITVMAIVYVIMAFGIMEMVLVDAYVAYLNVSSIVSGDINIAALDT